MPFHTRLFLRIILKGREAYFLKIITLAVAFACATLVILFSAHEFGYDRFHRDYHNIFRVIQRNNHESFNGNRLSIRIPSQCIEKLKSRRTDSLIISQVKNLNGLQVIANKKNLHDFRFVAADYNIVNVFDFQLLEGSWEKFEMNSAILSASSAAHFFGKHSAVGKSFKVFAYSDTLEYSVAAVYQDFPQNSHKELNAFLYFDTTSIHFLNFNPDETGAYGKIIQGKHAHYESQLNNMSSHLTYSLQPLSEIYFGPHVMGEDSAHGDYYSIIILICITTLIFFLAISNLVNLTTLTLPFRSKELAIKKLAGTSQTNLMMGFARESFLIVGSSLVIGMLFLMLSFQWATEIFSFHPLSMLLPGNGVLLIVLIALVLVVGLAPLFMTVKFTRATPNRLLSTETITFPRFKRTIMVFQLGISIFLIVASMVMRRQINYSLLKEPGRNHEQVVYVSYPNDLTNAGLNNLRSAWKKNHPNIVDVMACSQLPNQVSSKELASPFYFMYVDRGFKDFFDLEMSAGNWFGPNAGDSVFLVNELGNQVPGSRQHTIGVFRDLGEKFNLPEKPMKLKVADYNNYNYLCIRVLEVDIRRTMNFLSGYFAQDEKKAKISFVNNHFEEWLLYQDRLNSLSEILAIISAVLSCCAIYGLSISVVRDKIKQIAIHKLFGANMLRITRLLIKEFMGQLILAILFFGPLTYILLSEILRSFVYATHFNWLDPVMPLGYCLLVIAMLCGFQALSLNRENLSATLRR